jgi:shikimate dehydrogenase
MNGLLMLVAQAKRASELFLDTVLDDAVIPTIVRKIRLETENLILIGMPGCGKSTAARLLSELSGREEIDTDKLFPSYSGGKSPAEMICEDGEPAFRATETEVVRAVGKLSGKIIATGGGVPTIPANYDLLHQNGIIVYLMRDLTYLPTSGRPISQDKGLEALYNERKSAYERFADVAVRGRRDPKATAKAILDAFRAAIQKET